MEDQNLLLLARNIITENKANTFDVGKWNHVKAKVFVTAYKKQGSIASSNVWCCMTGGTLDNSVYENVIISAKNCQQYDSRITSVLPEEFHITVLFERKRYQVKSPRNNGTAVYMETTKGSAYFLPTVWNELKVESQFTNALRVKAGGSNAIVKAIYEIPVYEVGSPLFQDVMKRCLQFYLRFSKNSTLAYKIVSGTPNYYNENIWVRSYFDVLALHKLSPVVARPFVRHILKNNGGINDLQAMAARLDLMLETGWTIGRLQLINDIFTNRIAPGLYSNELAFANPQIVKVMVKVFKNKYGDETGFLKIMETQIQKILKLHTVFAANHISQALPRQRYRGFVKSQLCSVLKNTKTKSNTEEACAITGLIALGGYRCLKIAANRLETLCTTQLSHGGFEYGCYEYKKGFRVLCRGGALVRTDITSHVVEALVALTNLNFL